jgi:hypothetical protein
MQVVDLNAEVREQVDCTTVVRNDVFISTGMN